MNSKIISASSSFISIPFFFNISTAFALLIFLLLRGNSCIELEKRKNRELLKIYWCPSGVAPQNINLTYLPPPKSLIPIFTGNISLKQSIMPSIKLTVEIILTPIEDRELPSIERISDKVTEYIYDYILDEKVIVQSVHLTHINDEATQ